MYFFGILFDLEEHPEMTIINFGIFEKIIYMKLYSLLISNKILKYKKTNVKTLKNTKLDLFPRRILSCKQAC